jgi:serine protease Do
MRYGLGGQRAGVRVDAVAVGTDAFDRGLKAGDIILRVADAEVATPQAVAAAVEAARAAGKVFAVALVLSQAEQYTGPKWMALRVAVTR